MVVRTERRRRHAVPRLSLIALTTIVASIGPPLAHAQISSYVYVAADDGLRLIDAATGRPVSDVLPYSTYPTNLVVTPDGRRVFITGGTEAGRVDFLDLVARTTNSVFLGADHDNPIGLAVTPDGRRVLNTDGGGLTVFDAATRATLGELRMFDSAPVAITPDGQRAYFGDYDAVSAFDLATETVLHSISVPRDIEDLVVAPDGLLAYSSSREVHAVQPIDLVGHFALPPIEVPYRAGALAISLDGRVLCVAHPFDDKVSVIETPTRSVVATVDVGEWPGDLTVTPDGTAVYVSNDVSQTISIVDAITPSTGVPTWRVTRPARDFRGYALGVGPLMIVPAASGTSFEIGGDADLTARGFGTRLVSFDGGTLRLTGRWSTGRHLSVWPAGATIDTNGFDGIIGGGMTSDGPLAKRGAGTLFLSGSLSPGGSIQVEGGALAINGTYRATLAVGAGATLGGDGALGFVIARAGATISPGLDHTGHLEIDDLLMSPGSTFVANVGPYGEQDSLRVHGTGIIDGVRLTVRVGATPPRVGDDLLVLLGVRGTFAGLSNGSVGRRDKRHRHAAAVIGRPLPGARAVVRAGGPVRALTF